MAGCTSLPPAVTVIASSETTVPARDAQTLGAPAIWAGWTRPEPGASPVNKDFIVSTTSAGGLVFFGQDGEVAERLSGPVLDEIDVSSLAGDESYAVIIGGSRRVGRNTRLVFYRQDYTPEPTTRYWGEIATDLAEPQGFCMRQIGDTLKAAAIDRHGAARVFHISQDADGGIQSRETLRFHVDGTGKGCAIDPFSGQVYFSLAKGGFARASLSTSGEPLRLMDPTARRLPHSLGVAFLSDHITGYLTSLDEDRRGFSVWRLQGDSLTWMGRFQVRGRADARASGAKAASTPMAEDTGLSATALSSFRTRLTTVRPT